jgi:nucleoid-associated protein YgaU
MIGRRSRYATSILFTSAEGDFLGVRPTIDRKPRPDDRFHTVVDGDRVDLLAFRYLGRAELWWIICDYNDIFFPPELTPGAILRIPSTEHVSMRLLD